MSQSQAGPHRADSLREGGVSGLSPQDQEHFWVASLAPFLRAAGAQNGGGSLESTAECGFTKPQHQQNSPLQPTQPRALLSSEEPKQMGFSPSCR